MSFDIVIYFRDLNFNSTCNSLFLIVLIVFF